tara:strand:- start:190 stop:681 length:492 start_codon:yes stop_codon:yes gene_type:complete
LLGVDKITARLEKLVGLLEEIQHEKDFDETKDDFIFGSEYVQTMEDLNWVKARSNMWSRVYKEETLAVVEIMRRANNSWSIYQKVQSGEVTSIAQSKLYSDIRDFIRNGHKISAIKRYREYMLNIYNKKISLRTAKDVIDCIAYNQNINPMKLLMNPDMVSSL